MADESILDQALNLIPGVRTRSKRPTPSRQNRLSVIQRNLARLTKDVEALATMIVGKPSAKKASSAKKAKPAAARARAAATTRKAAPARKPSTKKRTSKAR